MLLYRRMIMSLEGAISPTMGDPVIEVIYIYHFHMVHLLLCSE